MREITRLLEPALAEALGWTLLHTLWQGALLALGLALLLILSRKRRPQFRYWCAVGTLLSTLLLAIVTFVWLYEPAGHAPLPAAEAAPLAPPAGGAELAGTPAIPPASWLNAFQPYLPFLAVGWLLGVLLLGLRLLGELAYLQHLRHYRCTVLDGEWASRLADLSRRVGLSRTVELRETARIHSPMVSGVFKPIILLPIGMVNGLSAAEVESILLHELAHVRRLDYLANLLISVVETLFFFHPFVWWMGSRIRTEREHACDDLVIEITGNAAAYVTALAQAESWRVEGKRLAMAFAGSTVLQRVKRILGQETGTRLISARAAGAVLVAGCAGLLLSLSTPTQAEQAMPFEKELISTVMETDSIAEPQPEPEPEPEWQNQQEPQPAIPQPMSTTSAKTDTLPPAPNSEAEAEREMEALKRELRQQERELEKQALQAEKTLRAALLEQERALANMESRQKAAQLELERAMRELEAQEQELELEELELEEQELELDRQEEELDRLSPEANEQAYLEKMRALQKQELQLMEAQRQLEDKAFALEEQMRKIELQATQQEHAMERRQRVLERKMHQMERQEEQQMLRLEQQQELMEAEAEAKLKALRRNWKEAKRQQGEGPQ